MNETPQQNQPPAQPAAQTPSAATQPLSPSEPKKGNSKAYLYALLTFLVGIGVGYVLVTQFPGSKVAETPTDKKTVKAVSLPGDALKVQACVAQKGELHAKPGDLPYGPIYMVDKEKVIGLEYILNQEDFNKGKIYDKLNTFDSGVNHMQVATMSADFSGKPGNYYVVDLYLVDQKTKDGIVCEVPSPTIPEASPSAAISSAPQVSSVPQVSAVPQATPTPVVAQEPTVGATTLSQ